MNLLNQYVVRFEIPVDHAATMSGVNGAAYLTHDIDSAQEIKLLFTAHQTAQRMSLYELHHQIDDPFRRHSEISNSDGVRMMDSSGGLGFEAESFDRGLIGYEIGLEQLDCEFSVDVDVRGAVDVSHPTFANEFV